jgi:hypothetical protein
MKKPKHITPNASDFRAVDNAAAGTAIEAELRWLGAVLGRVRDLGLVIDALLAPRQLAADRP